MITRCFCRSINTQHICEVSEEKLQKLRQNAHIQTVDPTEGGKSSQLNATSQQTDNADQAKSSDKTEHTINANPSNQTVLKSVQEKIVPSSSSSTSERRLKHRYDDSLEMDMLKGPLHHEPAKLITVEDSVKVLEKQQKLHKVSFHSQNIKNVY